jgi:ral guanine nucleotide dissociation stimulator
MAGQGNCQQGQASDSANCPSSSTVISSILNTWLNQYLEDFFQPPDFPCLKLLIDYLQLNMPGSNEECHAQLLLVQWEHLECSEPETESEQPGARI